MTDKKHDNNAIWNFEDAYEEKIDYLYSIKNNKEFTRVPQLNYNLAVSNDLNSTVFSNALFKSAVIRKQNLENLIPMKSGH